MKVGIIGCGMIVQVHGPVIRQQKGVELVGIADRDEARARAVSAQLGAGRVYGSAEAMIAAEHPDIVHVLTPPSTHADVVVAALQAGCHVLVEKPMALRPEDAKRMADAARSTGRKLCVNHNMLYEPTVARARALVASGRIGRVVSVDAYFSYNAMRNPSLMEDGAELCHWAYKLNGGPLQDQMPHMASLVFEYLPELRDVQIHQVRRGVLPDPWPDEIRVLIDGGTMTGQIAISFSERPDTILYTIRGTLGTVQANLFNGILTVQRQSRMPRAASRGLSGFQTGWQNTSGAIGNIWNVLRGKMDKSNGIAGVVSRFYEAVRNGSDAPVDLGKALRTVEFMDRVWPEPLVKAPPAAEAIRVTAAPAPSVLVTGASGFLGSHLVRRLLADGVGVRAMMRPNSIHAGRMKRLGVELFIADLSNPESLRGALQGIRTVYHVAAPMNNDWHEHEEITIQGTKNLIAAALEAKLDRLLFVSTLAVYDLLSYRDDALVREDGPYSTNSRQMGPYAHCKIEAEEILLTACRTQKLPVTIVRPGIIIGPTGRVFFPHLGMKNGDTLFIVIGKGTNVLPLTFVDNTVDGMIKAANSPKTVGQIYNLVDDGAVTINDYLGAFVKQTGIPSKIVHIPYALPYLAFGGYEVAAGIGLLPKGKTSRRQLRWKTKSVRFDRSKAAQDFGWQTTVPIEEGMRRTFAWYVSKFGSER